MKKTLLACGLLALVLAIGFFLSKGPPSEEGGVEALHSPVAIPEESPPDRQDLPAIPRAEDVEAVAPATQREAIVLEAPPGAFSEDTLVISEQDPEGQSIEIVISGGERPLPGATVTLLSGTVAMSAGAEEMMADGGGFDGVLNALGRHYRADDEGKVRVPELEPQSFVRAYGLLGGHRYRGMSEADSELQRVLVTPELGFNVTVVDSSGAPVAEASLEFFAEARRLGRQVLSTTRTDAKGEAFLPNVLIQMGEKKAERMIDTERGDRTLVALAGFFAEAPEVVVDYRTTLPREIQLVRPATGRVEVKLWDEAGRKLVGGSVSLSPAGLKFRTGNQPPHPKELQRKTSPSTEEGALFVFETVERGTPFDLHFLVRSDKVLVSREALIIPEDQDILRVDLVAKGVVPRVTGRVFAGDGRDLTGARVYLATRSSWKKIRRRALVPIDAAGRFELAAYWPRWLEDDPIMIHCLHEGGGESYAEPGPRQLEIVKEGMVLKLGDLVLKPLPLDPESAKGH